MTVTLEPQGLTAAENGATLSHPRAEILGLTGLRGLAMLGVVVHNIGLPASAPGRLDNLFDSKFLLLPLFVMLSGFVLAYNYPQLSPRAGVRRLGRFYLARLARIVPLVAVVLLYLLILQSAYGVDGWLVTIFKEQAWVIALLCSLYVVFPVLVSMVRSTVDRTGLRGVATVLTGAFVTLAAVVAVVWSMGGLDEDSLRVNTMFFRNPLVWIPVFVMGMALAFAAARGFTVKARTANLLQVASLLVVVVIASDYSSARTGRFLSYGLVWAIPFALIILTVAVSRRSWLARLLSTRLMVHLGVLSLAWFLFNKPVLNGMGERLAHGTDVYAYLMVMAITAITLLIAEGAHRYLESPLRTYPMTLARHYDRDR